MSFDVYLFASSTTPPAAEFRTAVREAVGSDGGSIAPDGVAVRLSDGAELELFMEGEEAGGMAALRDVTPSICRLLYRVADRTNAFIVPTDGDDGSYRTPGNRGAVPAADFPPPKTITSPEALCKKLAPGHGDWAAFREEQGHTTPK